MGVFWRGGVAAETYGESAAELHEPPGETHEATATAAATTPGVIGYRPNKVGAGVPVTATEAAPESSEESPTAVAATATDSTVPEARQVDHFRRTGNV